MHDVETQNSRILKIDDGKCEALRVADYIHLLILNTLCKLKLFILNLFKLCTKCQNQPPKLNLIMRRQVPLANVTCNKDLTRRNTLNGLKKATSLVCLGGKIL